MILQGPLDLGEVDGDAVDLALDLGVKIVLWCLRRTWFHSPFEYFNQLDIWVELKKAKVEMLLPLLLDKFQQGLLIFPDLRERRKVQ